MESFCCLFPPLPSPPFFCQPFQTFVRRRLPLSAGLRVVGILTQRQYEASTFEEHLRFLPTPLHHNFLHCSFFPKPPSIAVSAYKIFGLHGEESGRSLIVKRRFRTITPFINHARENLGDLGVSFASGQRQVVSEPVNCPLSERRLQLDGIHTVQRQDRYWILGPRAR